jgi:spore coat protein U-like protein
MAFGNYTNGAATTGTATVTPICSNTTPYTVDLSAGLSTGATVTARAMFVTGTPAVLLNYALYSDAALTVNFATSASITGTGAAQPLTVYGNIPGGQTIAPGAYQDTITATITY